MSDSTASFETGAAPWDGDHEACCYWCNKTYAEHRDAGPDARMPCLGRKKGFVARAKPREPTVVMATVPCEVWP